MDFYLPFTTAAALATRATAGALGSCNSYYIYIYITHTKEKTKYARKSVADVGVRK